MRYLKALGWLWALPTTLVGLALFYFGLASPYKLRSAGVLQFVARRGPWAWFFRRYSFGAITIGAATCFADGSENDPVMLRHELQHTYQAFAFGVFFIPTYYALSFWAWMNGFDSYRGNLFEVQAYAVQNDIFKETIRVVPVNEKGSAH